MDLLLQCSSKTLQRWSLHLQEAFCSLLSLLPLLFLDGGRELEGHEILPTATILRSVIC